VTETSTAPVRRIEWRQAQVRGIQSETARVNSILLQIPDWPGHRPGQHVDVRLTAEDGYQAERSYSIASPPENELVSLTVERLEDGEVSPYLVGELRINDRLELRGPIGGYFVWTVAARGPLYLVAGGSGIVPLMAMLRHRRSQNNRSPTVLLFSSRAQADIIYREELEAMAADDRELRVIHTLTRESADTWTGHRGRVDGQLLRETSFPPSQHPKIFICGPTPFVEAVSRALVGLGHDPGGIKTERFGPSGG
jgi:ferredoxin-NADP reductase